MARPDGTRAVPGPASCRDSEQHFHPGPPAGAWEQGPRPSAGRALQAANNSQPAAAEISL